MGLGQRLKDVRGVVSQKDFGAIFGVTPNTLRRYETETNPPTTDFILAVCDKFEIRPLWLLTGNGPKDAKEASDGINLGNSECSDPRCVRHRHAHGHILAKTPPFDAEILSHIFAILHEFKDNNPEALSKEHELDVISLCSMFLQPENKLPATLISRIISSWYNK